MTESVMDTCLSTLQDLCNHPEVEMLDVGLPVSMPVCMCCGKILEEEKQDDGSVL